MAVTLYISTSPLNSAGDAVHRRYKAEIVDELVYDTEPACYPATTSSYTFGISGVTAADTVLVTHNGESVQTLQGNTGYTFKLYPIIGPNTVEAVVGAARSAVMFTTDELHAMVYPVVRGIRRAEAVLHQSWADSFLTEALVPGVDGRALEPSGAGLRSSWGTYLQVFRLSGHTVSQYIAMLQTALRVYRRGAVAASIEDSVVAASGSGATDNPVFRLGVVARAFNTKWPRLWTWITGATTTTLEVFPQKVEIGSRSYNVPRSLITLTSTRPDLGAGTGDTRLWLTPGINGGLDSNGNIVVQQSTGTPADGGQTTIETISSGGVMTDTDGTITGLEGQKYVILNYIPSALTFVVSSSHPQYALTNGCQTIEDADGNPTAVLALGTRLDIFTGNTSVVYIHDNRDTRLLARIVCAIGGTPVPTDINEIRGPSRVGFGAIHLTEVGSRKRFVILGQKDSGADFTSEEKAWAYRVINELSPLGADGFLLFQEAAAPAVPPSADLYHLEGFAYYGAI